MAFQFTNLLKDTKVLVIGGSSGIGLGIAQGALEYGAQVFISSSSQAKIDAAVSKLEAECPLKDPKVHGRAVDLRSNESVKELMQWVDETGDKKGIQHLVYTAGDPLNLKPFAELDFDETKSFSDIRFWCVLRAVQAAHPYMRQHGRQASVTLTSGSAFLKPNPGWGLVAGVAAGTDGLARGLAVDLAPVRVNTVLPGAVDTPLWDGMPEEQRKQVYDMYRKKLLTGEIGHVNEVAAAYLMCMMSTFITGTSIKIDGGEVLN